MAFRVLTSQPFVHFYPTFCGLDGKECVTVSLKIHALALSNGSSCFPSCKESIDILLLLIVKSAF